MHELAEAAEAVEGLLALQPCLLMDSLLDTAFEHTADLALAQADW